eukprot:CAMPEP_0206198202 /NCGR_PEP_ID=MMETSP0166-20121206/9494_1 /ASSEMBLY_ACC=CAM_ASM_000260 /TAXON_ID=95228 /ORGANISM="Vannella robusta, Strain DIVA3 518/3/11/1/6" /LENGTH=238 /DNA_ID=CAMNT_0053616005 /DNA_START=738 /DNA_END=1450 /DNA_ORIENTATION=-
MNLHKERSNGRTYQFTKAAGCRVVQSVVELPPETTTIEHTRNRHSKTDRIRFLYSVKCEIKARGSEFLTKSSNTDEQQKFPVRGSSEFIAPAHHQKYLEVVSCLYRRYFSPDMHYIFPLMVYQQEQFGLDFTSTETWLIFGDIPEEGPIPHTLPASSSWMKYPELPVGMTFPSGAVTWRLNMGRNTQEGILEVMFIAVWESQRGHQLGSRLVQRLEEESRQQSVSFLYVEIGHEQSKA